MPRVYPLGISHHPVKRWTLFETSVVMLSWVEGRKKVNRYSKKKLEQVGPMLTDMAIRVVEFSNGGYKIRKGFA